MKKLYGVNIVFFVLIAILFLIISCSEPGRLPEAGQLKKADRDFSKLSESSGMYRAFLSFVADSGVLLRDNGYPLIGKGRLEELFASGSDTSFVLTWEPAYEKISASGDLGYTYGYYTRKIKATGEIARGTYLTIWQKQPDGSWKFILDTGTQGLPEKSE
jgi:ketosteroid isomerase-like protein